MKAITINVQIVKNIGNYETIRLGGEWSLDEAETITEATKKAMAELEEAYKAMKEPAPEKPAKKRLEFGTPLFQAVINKVNDGKVESVDFVRQYYEFGEAEEKAIEMAIMLHKGKEAEDENK